MYTSSLCQNIGYSALERSMANIWFLHPRFLTKFLFLCLSTEICIVSFIFAKSLETSPGNVQLQSDIWFMNNGNAHTHSGWEREREGQGDVDGGVWGEVATLGAEVMMTWGMPHPRIQRKFIFRALNVWQEQKGKWKNRKRHLTFPYESSLVCLGILRAIIWGDERGE